MKKLVILICFVAAGCVSSLPGFPGYIYESVSSYDGSKQLSMVPALLEDAIIKFSLTKNSRWQKDEFLLTVYVFASVSIIKENSLHFNVDGETYHFSSGDEITEIDFPHGSIRSSRSYEVSRAFLDKIMAGGYVGVKIDTRTGYHTGKFTDIPTGAKRAFKDFLVRADAL